MPARSRLVGQRRVSYSLLISLRPIVVCLEQCRRGTVHGESYVICRVKSAPYSMALIVQKFGGTSVGSTERIRNVARRIAKWKAAGHGIVAVPPAMAGETNRPLALAAAVQAHPEPRELDVVAATGEPVTGWRLALAVGD